MIANIENLFMFCGGLGMFLFGMNNMSDGIQKVAGNRMKELLGILTNNRLMGVLVGALITAIIQSSGATTVMVVGFVNAGIMNLAQAVGVIMGANIGTTITAWIVSLGQVGETFKALSPSLYAPLILGIGSLLIMFSKKQGKKIAGEILVGVGLLFIGLDFMQAAAKPYTNLPIFATIFEALGNNPILGILVGVIVTAIMQSSSASVGILQTLAATGGAVTFSSAVFISLGSNIGSCCTALLSSLGAPRNAKRTAVIHLTFNTIGVILFGTALTIYFQFDRAFANMAINSVTISIFHTIFNVICTILLFPFANLLVKISGMIVKESPAEKNAVATEESMAIRRLDRRILESPAIAVSFVNKEVAHMGYLTAENVMLVAQIAKDLDQEKIDKVNENEETINHLERILTDYLIEVNNLSLTKGQHQTVNNLFYTISDIERVGDHAQNIAELMQSLRDSEIEFSETGKQDLEMIFNAVQESFCTAVEARECGSMEYACKVESLEDRVDNLEEELRAKHIQRLSAGECKTSAGVVFLDIISNLERISDHADNIAGYVKEEH